jgi:hypothetical protein
MAALRPVLMPSRPEDSEQKISFVDGKWLHIPAGGGVAEVTDEAIYLALSLRNVGTGIAVLHGWRFDPELDYTIRDAPDPDIFRRLTRDLYVPVADEGFWQGAFREPEAEEFAVARAAIEARKRLTIDLLYGDHEGGQRVITRFLMTPRGDNGWIATTSRHWNIDRPDPR